MEIICSNNGFYKQQPRTKLEKLWLHKHQAAIQYAKEYNTCPSCGRFLGKKIALFDHGFRDGIECEYCR